MCSGPRQFSAYLKGSLLELVLMSFCFVKLIFLLMSFKWSWFSIIVLGQSEVWVEIISGLQGWLVIREFKTLWWQLRRKRHMKIELCVKLSLLQLFGVDHVVQNRQSALSLAWHKWFSFKGKEWKIYCRELALSSEPQMWKVYVVVWQTTSEHCTYKRAARAAWLFCFI